MLNFLKTPWFGILFMSLGLMFAEGGAGASGGEGEGEGDGEGGEGSEGAGEGKEGEEGAGKEGDKGTPSWRDDLGDDIKDNPLFDKYGSRDDALRALVGAQDLIGKKGLIQPDENSSKDEWDNFYKDLGRPESAEKYTLPEIEGLPEGLPIDDNLTNDFKAWAHEAGLNQNQVNLVYGKYQTSMATMFNGIEEAKVTAKNEAETDLRAEWGKAFPEKKALVDKLIKHASEKELAFFTEHGNDPRLVSFFARIGGMMGEDQLGGTPKGLTKTPDEARAEILRIKADMTHPFNQEDSPERPMAMAAMNLLYKLAHPELSRDTK